MYKNIKLKRPQINILICKFSFLNVQKLKDVCRKNDIRNRDQFYTKFYNHMSVKMDIILSQNSKQFIGFRRKKVKNNGVILQLYKNIFFHV